MYNNLNASRMKAIGLNKYEWVHSGGGQRPREFHRDVLNGQIFSLDDPPIIDEQTGERGIPSQLINCRCTMLPLLEFSNGQNLDKATV
jgi:SPP1 gp7 family putative phage head morphogenesis protein